MITDEMVEAALKAEEEYHASNDISYTSEGMRRALSAALAAMPQEPVAWRETDATDAVLAWMVGQGWLDANCEYTATDIITALNDNAGPSLASPVQGATAPAVKALEWYDLGNEGIERCRADTGLFGTYSIAADGGGFVVISSYYSLDLRASPTLQAAKAAAQADFERRIHSCLTGAATAPSEEDDMRAAREAAAKAAEVFGGYGMAAAFRAGDHDDKGTVRASLIALRTERAKGAA